MVVDLSHLPSRHDPASLSDRHRWPGHAAAAEPALPEALLLVRLMLERYCDTAPQARRATDALDQLQPRLRMEDGAPALDREAVAELYSAVRRIRAAVQ